VSLGHALQNAHESALESHAEANLTALIESTDDLIWSIDLNYGILTYNSALKRHIERNFGTQIALGKRPEDLLPPERAALWPPLFSRALKQGPYHIEVPFPAGRTLEMAFHPIVVAGQPAGISIFGKDITEQKSAEERSREANRRLRDIFDCALEGIFQTAPDASILSVNPALAAMLGYDSPEELKAIVVSVTEEVWADPAELAQFAQQIAETGTVSAFECRLKRKDGSIFWGSMSCRRLLGPDGNPTYYEGFIQDISERKLATEALGQTAEFLKETQRIGAIGSYDLDIQRGVWTSSEVLDEIFGIDSGFERTVATWTSLVHPSERACMAAYFAGEVVGKRQEFDREYRIVRQSDQAERWVHGRGRLLFGEDGTPLRLAGIIRDITERKLAELQLRDSEERYRSTFEQAAVGIIHTAFDGRFLRANTRFAEIIGYPQDEISNLTVQQITAPEDLPSSLEALRNNVIEAFVDSTLEKRYIRKDGSITWVRITISTQRDLHGNPLHYITLVEDINALKAAEEALRDSEQRYRTIFMTSLDAISISRLSDGRYIDVNKAFLDTLEMERDDVIGRTSLELGIWADPRDRQNFVDALHQSSFCRDVEVRFRKKTGKTFWALSSASIIEMGGVPCMLGVIRDISEAKEAANTIRDLAYYDSLTGLPNRRLLLERLNQTIAATERSPLRKALLVIDLDEFKTLNDTLGHSVGDLMLQEAARRILCCAGETDMVGRLGGDEFVLLLEDLNPNPEIAAAKARLVAEKLLGLVSQPYMLDGHECRSTASLGIAVFGDMSDTANEILQQADLAMDQAKAAGRNSMHFFAPALQLAVNARAALEEDLRKAIKSQEFVLYFQPQVDGKSLIGAEALVRWNHPRRGILAPGEFISLAEETGLILPLGNWVLEAACQCIAQWASIPNAAHLSLAVNISARQFREPDFVDQVLSAIQRTGADPRNLKLELTESMLVENIDEVIATMRQLKSHGLRFSLDDFGTGYSSLAYLRRLPLDQLKIDRSFIRDILVDQSSGAIAQTIVSLSKAMGLPVIAEGVENEEQREFLVELGCHCFQGYLFSRPLPIEEFQRVWLGVGLPVTVAAN
jgi:diguanylate cyclase (GGDEF)-like protein/PAS domain S-box-containing protein